MSPDLFVGFAKTLAFAYLLVLATSATLSLARIARAQAKLADKS